MMSDCFRGCVEEKRMGEVCNENKKGNYKRRFCNEKNDEEKNERKEESSRRRVDLPQKISQIHFVHSTLLSVSSQRHSLPACPRA
jgi:hypothetical protein